MSRFGPNLHPVLSLLALAACVPLIGAASGDHDAIDLVALQAMDDAAFVAHDLDGDGMITRAEFTQAGPGPDRFDVRIEHGAAADPGSGETVEVEIYTPPAAPSARIGARMPARERFDAADRDGDGRLSFDEFAALGSGPPIELDIELDGQVAGHGGFDAFDTNADGVITRTEWPSPAAELAHLDHDGDGRIADEELAGPGARVILRRSHRAPHLRP